MKVLHTADLHLGMTYGPRPYPDRLRERLIESRFLALERLVETANRERCGMLVVAGDLFHRPNVKRDTVLRVIDILSGFTGNCVAVLPGNHDHFDGFGTTWKDFRENATDSLLLLEETRPYSLENYGLDAVLYPAPCHSRHSRENRLGWLKECHRPPARWHLGVAHGSLKGVSPDFDRQYFPMEAGELLATGLHHWFLGHTHLPYPGAAEVKSCRFTISGTPEPDGFDCRHEGSAWLVEFPENGETRAVLLKSGMYRFLDLKKELAGLADLDRLENELGVKAEQALVRLTLSGVLPGDQFPTRAAKLEELRASFAYLEYDDSNLLAEITAETIAAEFPAGSFPGLLLTGLAEKGEPLALQLAYQLIKKVRK